MKYNKQLSRLTLLALLIFIFSGCHKEEPIVSKMFLSPQYLYFAKDSIETVFLSMQPPQPFEWRTIKMPKGISIHPETGSSNGDYVELKVKRDIHNPINFAYQEIEILTNIAGSRKIKLMNNGYIYDCLSIIPDSIHFPAGKNEIDVFVNFRVDYPHFNTYDIVFQDHWLNSSARLIDYSYEIEIRLNRYLVPDGRTSSYIHFINNIYNDTTSYRITFDTTNKAIKSAHPENFAVHNVILNQKDI